MRYAVILAGGAGKRLWPMSRASRPKQLLPFVGGKSLLQLSIERLEGLFDNEHILVITSAEYADQVAAALKQLPRDNVIGEPLGRDTANAIALGAAILSARDEDATMAIFTADHVIRPVDAFAEAVRGACETAEGQPNALLTFGIRPTWPHTGLGYIHRGEQAVNGAFEVSEFKEKPDHHTARQYVESGEYYWNSGMFVWKLGAIRRALEEFLPQSVKELSPVARAAAEGRPYDALLAQAYPQLQKISIDYAVMERAREVLMVELNCEWLDLGTWAALEEVSERDDAGNVVLADECLVLDTTRSIIVSDGGQLLAVLGMDGCVVVQSDNATLVCNKTDCQQIKHLVDLIEQKYPRKYT